MTDLTHLFEKIARSHAEVTRDELERRRQLRQEMAVVHRLYPRGEHVSNVVPIRQNEAPGFDPGA